MSQTQINGGTQIRAGTVTLDRLVAGYSVPSANLADGANFLKKDGSVAMSAAFNLGGYTAQNSGSPANATDLTTKAYVDAKTAGIGGWHGVRILQATNMGALSGLSAIDGVTPVAGDLILPINQAVPAQNGPWVAAAGSWTRPTWWAGASSVNEGQYFLVAEGTTYKDTKWFCTTTGAITVDTTSVAFQEDLSGAVYTAGTGLTLTGNAFSVNYGTTGGTAAQGNDSRIIGALQTSALGANVQTALGVAVGSAGAVVVNGGALGTPSSGTLTNCSGLPIGSIASLGSNVATALATAAGLANGFPVLAAGGYLAAADFPAISGDVTIAAGSLVSSVNNTSGSGFAKYTNFVVGEVPGGTINGANATFTLAHTPATVNGGVSSLGLLMDGVRLTSGAGNDYTVSGATITMLNVPQTGDTLAADYMI